MRKPSFRMRDLVVLCLFAGTASLAMAQQQTEAPSGFSIYGQINRGILAYDDGALRDTHWLVDNSKSVSRLGATYDQPLNGGWRLRARGEVALRWRATNAVSQIDPDDSSFEFDRTQIRKLETHFAHDTIGTFSIGQGAMAADGITGMDLSLTTVVAGAPVQDAAGGQYLRLSSGGLSSLKIKQAFRSLGSSRRLRLRYDAPLRSGVRFVAAAGQEVLSYSDDRNYADTSLRYDGEHGEMRVRVGGAYRWIEDKDDVFIASGSILHRPSGWNLTMASGWETSDARYHYAKIGYIGRWFDMGQTAISVDGYMGDDIAGMNGASVSYGLAVVQKIKQPKMDVYALLRRYEYSAPGQAYQDSLAFLTGVRWQF